MGTRNYTKIYYKGKLVLSQYGQWDGYPTGQLAVICDFLRDRKNEELLKLNLKKVKVGKEAFKFNKEETNILHKYFEIVSKKYKAKFEGDYFGLYNVEQKMQILRNYGMSNEEAVFCIANDRDTGSEILELIVSPSIDKIKKIKINFHEDGEEEGNYTINLDDRKVYANYHNYKRTFKFDKLPSYEDLEAWQEIIEKKETARINKELAKNNN